jgi:hypothetical protein
MPYSRFSVLIVEDDSRISRHLRDDLLAAMPSIRAEIAGSPAKAHLVCTKFPPTVIVWDGAPNARGTQEEYANCIPERLWPKVLPISVAEDLQAFAASKGAMPPCPKRQEAIGPWSDEVTKRIMTLLKNGKQRKH